MIDQHARSPLSGKYLVRNRALNRLLRLTDWLLGWWARSRAPHPAIPEPRRILLANGAHLGDVLASVQLLPALHRAFPRVQLGFLIGHWARPLLHDHPLLAWVHIVDHWKLNRAPLPLWHKIRHYQHTRRQALREIRQAGYDVAIDLYCYFPNAISLLWQAGIPVRMGYTSGGFGPLLTHSLDWTNQDRHITEYQADLLRLLPLSENDLACRHIAFPAEVNQLPQVIRNELPPSAVPAPDYLVFHMGAGTALKEWPLANWRCLAERVVGEGYTLVFTGNSTAETWNCDQVAAGLDRCINACGRLNWSEFVATIRHARLLVGVDSVAGHVAAAVGTACVEVFSGISNPAQWGPRGAACKLVQHPVPCAPCYRSRGCPTMDCVRLVDVEAVHVAIQELLRLPLAA
jgi:ADP-heptose:LPS heptosyltransferase